MPLPTPTHSFTIPSIYDGIQLDCRLYHPPRLRASGGTRTWPKKAAIVAHPYATLGGCFDDPVVSMVGNELLNGEYVVGTFNFRGAGNSKGRTSWTAKPELADFISFYGFMIFYIRGLEPRLQSSRSSNEDQISVGHKSSVDDEKHRAKIILGGYSYGSMIANFLPSVEAIQNIFDSATKGTSIYGIKQEAFKIYSLWNNEMRSRMTPPKSVPQIQPSESIIPANSGSGESPTQVVEGEPTQEVKHQFGRLATNHGGPAPYFDNLCDAIDETSYSFKIDVSYLLISPILPPLSFFTAMGLLTFSTRLNTTVEGKDIDIPDPKQKLTRQPVLAIYGTSDSFTSIKKLRNWSKKFIDMQDSRFASREVEGAGHFWQEKGSEIQMRREIKDWITKDLPSP